MVSLGPYRSDPGGLPELSSPTYHLQEIDTYIVQAKERSYETVLSFGKRGLNIAASAAVQAATKVPWAPVFQQLYPHPQGPLGGSSSQSGSQGIAAVHAREPGER